MYLNFDGRENTLITLTKTWQEFRNALKNKEFTYKELNKAKNYVFFKTFDDVISYGANKTIVTKTLKEIASYSQLCRATKLGEEDSRDCIPYCRFIPNQAKYPSENRFSPAGLDYLYLAIKFGKIKKKGKYSPLEFTCLKEIRASKDNEIALCNFKINEDMYDKKIIDLTITDNKTYEEIQQKFSKWFYSLNINDIHKNAAIHWFTLYLKMLSEKIFAPIETKDRELEYASFHCLAVYFNSIGFDGIVYKSTVYDNGKNLVLFDKMYAEPFGEIKIITY